MSKNLVMSIEYSVQDVQTGNQVDSNVGRAPLEFITGMGQIIEGLESALLKMSAGEKSDVKVDPEFGYGLYNDEAVQVLPVEQFAGIDLVQGMTLYGTSEDGETVQVAVKSFDDTNVVIDYNHPLAGKTLMFTVSLLEVRDATAEELATGYVGGMPSGGCCGGGSCGTGHDHDHSHGGGNCGSGHGHGHSGGGCGCH
jgi:FKBP-type peptidyl-prolyl cis-trans isomerase SlyD